MESIKPETKAKCWTASDKIIFHKSKGFMDYLHGDVEKSAAGLACDYEYARESKEMWEAAEKRDTILKKLPNLDCEKLVLWILGQDARHGRLYPMWIWSFLMCKSFPAKDWTQLSQSERAMILKRYEARLVPPLPMPDLLWEPAAAAMLAVFKKLAATNTTPIPEVEPGGAIPPMAPVPAMVQKHGSVYQCLFTVDFSESKDRLAGRFLEWLKQPAITELWQKFKNQRTSKPGNPPLCARKIRRHWNAVYFCLFEVDMSARKGDLTKKFNQWLALPVNRKRLKKYGKEKRGITGQALGRLKDLAAWRLYRENGNCCEGANQFAADNRKKFKNWPEVYAASKKVNGQWPYKAGDPRPFHHAKAAKDDDAVPANQASLFSCDDDYRHAKMKVMERLSILHPREFKKPSPTMRAVFEKFNDLASKP